MNMVARPSQERHGREQSWGRLKKCRNGQIETAGNSFAKANPQEGK
jgi:hypothetical protein